MQTLAVFCAGMVTSLEGEHRQYLPDWGKQGSMIQAVFD